ncbi:MAG: hypothetical protein ABIP94_12125 [Planctomycetota bacterium]
MTTTIRRLAATAGLSLLLTACTNYDFARACTATGELDVPKLIADLEASGKTQLQQGIWIPLLYLNLTTFGKNDVTLPDGYSIQHMKAFGPMFLAGGNEKQILDKKGDGIESWNRKWVGWGLLYYNRDNFVETTHGRRHEGYDRVLAVFGGDSTRYAPKQP